MTTEEIKKEIEELSDKELYELICLYCKYTHDDHELFCNDEEFFSEYFSSRPAEIIERIKPELYDPSAEYVYFGDYGYLETTDSVRDYFDKNFDIDKVAEYIKNNPDKFKFVILVY